MWDCAAGERCGGAQAQLGPRLQFEQRGGGLEGGAPQLEACLLETVGPLPHLALLSLQGHNLSILIAIELTVTATKGNSGNSITFIIRFP